MLVLYLVSDLWYSFQLSYGQSELQYVFSSNIWFRLGPHDDFFFFFVGGVLPPCRLQKNHMEPSMLEKRKGCLPKQSASWHGSSYFLRFSYKSYFLIFEDVTVTIKKCYFDWLTHTVMIKSPPLHIRFKFLPTVLLCLVGSAAALSYAFVLSVATVCSCSFSVYEYISLI